MTLAFWACETAYQLGVLHFVIEKCRSVAENEGHTQPERHATMTLSCISPIPFDSENENME